MSFVGHDAASSGAGESSFLKLLAWVAFLIVQIRPTIACKTGPLEALGLERVFAQAPV